MNRLIYFLIFSITFLVSCAGTVSLSNQKTDFNPIAVDNFNPVFSEIKNSQTKQNELLIVFDIDDTLLTSEQLLGSERWVQWYKNNQTKHQLLPCRFDVASMLYEIGTMVPTEPNLNDRFNAIQNNHVMLLTARSNKQRSATERELLRNKYFFSRNDRLPSQNDWSAIIHAENRKAEIVYRAGLMMVAGADKGKSLTEFLRYNDLNYKKIIFVDDKLHNLKNVYKAIENSKTKLVSFYFGGKNIKKEMGQDEVDKAIEANNWIRDALKRFFMPRYSYLTSPQPECLY
ncbi:MAG: DUF2608 domain-containing protein [Nitrospina sp.]|nr:DUF2608 domain-containing protein [Nitrospina sp.]MBT3510110.1 DUF2608 domain-containing protein [Nitrospina sp.]MBT3877355.1 DUF2608 domain-containing protein [Nitrospina sp.]MBT4046774.1 DUF2608 domain-containing protein [Nitrospina sp.]MBT4557504.1 DUF2608 domain-containing protein [Nitrospina sp.]